MRSLLDKLHLDITNINNQIKSIYITTDISDKQKIYEYKKLTVHKINPSSNFLLEIRENTDENIEEIDRFILLVDLQKIIVIGKIPLLPELKKYIYKLLMESEFRKEYSNLIYKKNLYQTIMTFNVNNEENNYDINFYSD